MSQGRGTPAQGCRGCRYSVPLGRGRGKQMEGRVTLADCGHQAKGAPAHLSPKVGGGVKKHYGEPCNAGGAHIFLLGGGPLNHHEADSADLTDGSLFD